MLSQFNGPKRPAPYTTVHMLGKKNTATIAMYVFVITPCIWIPHGGYEVYTYIGLFRMPQCIFSVSPYTPQSAMPSALCAQTKDFPCVTGQAIFARQLSHHLDINGDKCDLAGDYAFLFHFRSNLIQFLPPNAGIKKDQEVGRVDEVLLSYI